MADVSAARTKAVFEFKSATLPLIAVILKTSDLDVLAEALDAQLADSPDFFEQEPVVIDLSLLQESQDDGDIDFAALRGLLARHQTQPIAVRGGNDTQHAAARAAGLSVAAMPAAPAPRAPAPPAEPPASEAPQIVREVPVPTNGTLLIDKPLRSGQQVYARGGDVVVTAIVSFGAEVIADGNVHVYAPLRGKAIAGARGNTEARIFSTCMEAQLVAVAGIYRTNEVPLPDTVLGKPAQVRLDGKKISIDPIP
ncbi:septum site-determining protein MinC [Variovorax sp. 350MFTsu5.1]|uniref:septum site-determining protein MinC n=1 Tax=Variovorax sp. 350MFTsu5.1 TaxID=3158365 RepID=UPI003AAECA50